MVVKVFLLCIQFASLSRLKLCYESTRQGFMHGSVLKRVVGELRLLSRNASRFQSRPCIEQSLKRLMTIIIRPRKTEISRGYQHQSICFEAFIADGGGERCGWEKELQIIKAFLSRLFIWLSGRFRLSCVYLHLCHSYLSGSIAQYLEENYDKWTAGTKT